jgi:hypothetical protein
MSALAGDAKNVMCHSAIDGTRIMRFGSPMTV